MRESNNPKTNNCCSTIAIIMVALMILLTIIILMPLFKSARETALYSNGGEHLRIFGKAILLYTEDYDSMLPTSAINYDGDPDDYDGRYMSYFCKAYPSKKNDSIKTWAMCLSDYDKNIRENMYQIKNYNKDIRDFLDPAKDSNKTKISLFWWRYSVERAWLSEKHGGVSARSINDYKYPENQIIMFERKSWRPEETIGLKNNLEVNVLYLDASAGGRVLKNGASDEFLTIDYFPAPNAKSTYFPFVFNHDELENKTAPQDGKKLKIE
ncbi:MAG: hypothetical protein SNJ70_00005, partial [Armatimonadota bacterium]